MTDSRDRSPEPADEDLMLAVRGGDMRAFEKLVLRHQEAAWGAAFRFLGNAADAEDVAQQAFLRILEAAGRYEPTASFRTYLYRVVTRLCIDRAEKMRPALGADASAAPSPSPGPPEAAEERERGEAVRRALQDLPPRQRMAAVLRYVEGLSLREAAGAMETTEKALEHHLARAREGMEGRLSGFLGG